MNPSAWNPKTVRRNAIMALGLLVMVLIVHEIFGAHGYLAMRRQKHEYQALQLQIQNLKKQNDQLREQIQALKTNPQAIEKIARERMHFARPGEIIYALPKRDPKSAAPAATNSSSSSKP